MNEEYKPITNLWKDFEGYRYFGTLKLSSKIKYDGDDFIPLWEWVEQLQQENKKLNGAIRTYDILLKANVEENKQLKEKLDCDLQWAFKYEKQVDNWNKLKEWLEKELGDRINPNKDKWLTGVYDAYRETIDKMHELEQGSDNNE